MDRDRLGSGAQFGGARQVVGERLALRGGQLQRVELCEHGGRGVAVAGAYAQLGEVHERRDPLRGRGLRVPDEAGCVGSPPDRS